MVLDLDTESYTGPWLDQYGADKYYIPTWYTGIVAGTEKVGGGWEGEEDENKGEEKKSGGGGEVPGGWLCDVNQDRERERKII